MDCCAHEHDKHDAAPPEGAAAYTCPMHPEIVRKGPGMCPECGMALVPADAHGQRGGPNSGFNKHEGHAVAAFMRKFWIALTLTLPIVAYSDLPQAFFGWRAPQFSGAQYLSLVLGSIVFFYCGSVFLASARRELRARLPGMMTLIALAIATAYLWSVYATLAGEGGTLWWELSTLIAVMLLGHAIEMKAVQGAQGALKELAKLLPDRAEVMRGNVFIEVPVGELMAGDIVLVRPGAKVPADGRIVEGRSELDESILTGESNPVEKAEGADVIAGSINGDGSLKVEVTKIGDDTFLSGVMRLVADAQASKSRLQTLSDRAALYLTFIAVVSGVITLAAWLAAGASSATAIERVVAVLVIACPHALGLAIPLVASISTTLAARAGLLIRERRALEAARAIDVVLFDKTGTLTRGEFGITEIVPAEGASEEQVLALAAAVNGHSEHPIGKAIVAAARARRVAFEEASRFVRVPGQGARAAVKGIDVSVGNDALAHERGARFSSETKQTLARFAREGKTIVHVVAGGKLVGSMALADMIRAESREAVRALKDAGIEVAMVTGDSEDVAAWVARELGLDEYFAAVPPGEKAAKVAALQAEGKTVAMVGDGINDAPALTRADLGIAIGAGTNVAVESAGIILVRNDPRDIPKIIRLSRRTYAKMIQNLFWATGYNLAALPLAAGILAPWGIVLQPAVAAVFMSLSTVIVSVNAVLLRRQAL